MSESAYTGKEIFDTLEDEILSLKTKPGTILSENQLCERFGVSRSPIRSALQGLQLEDLVIVTPYKGTQVTRMDFSIINQMIYQRMAVETFVIEDFIQAHDELDMEKLRHLHCSMQELIRKKSFDAKSFYQLDGQLHAVWFSAGRKDYLWKSIQNSNCNYTRFRMLDIVAVRNFQQIVDEHAAILEAIEKQDRAAIRPLMQKHLFGGVTRLGRLIFTDLKDYFTAPE